MESDEQISNIGKKQPMLMKQVSINNENGTVFIKKHQTNESDSSGTLISYNT